VTIWVDAQLSPALARWLSQQFNLVALSVKELSSRSAIDPEIFFAAREANAVVLTKDQDFVHLLERHGAPPKVL
jgi:predicted nuclease of predicted toxin-antitoxin system